MDPAKRRDTFLFQGFELDLSSYELRRNGRRVKLERRPMDLLILMLQRRGELVARNEIVDALWPKDTFIEVEPAVNTLIRKIRQALRDSADAPRFIETVQGKGYRFIAPVELLPAGSQPLASSPPADLAADVTVPSAAADRRRPPVRRVAIGVVALLLVAVLALGIWKATSSGTAQLRLAVLPFEAFNIEPGREYLADALHEETILALGQVDPEHLQVIGRTSMLAYKGTRKSLAEIGRELAVDYLVETSIHIENGRVRVTPKLIRAQDQAQIWSAPFDSEPASMFELQRELGSVIAEQIRLRLSPDRLNALARRHSADAEAYDLYLRGLYFWNQLKPETTRRAIEFYTRATVRDPNYALPWAGLALAYAAAPINADAPPRVVWPKAQEAAQRAMRANPALAESQTALGMVQFWLDWNWTDAEKQFRNAAESDPTYPLAQRMIGIVLSHVGRHDDARAPMHRLRQLEPGYAMNHALSAQVAFNARDYPAALEFAKQATVLAPSFWIGHYHLAMALEQTGRDDLSLETITNTLAMGPGNSKVHALRGYVLAKTGQTEHARDVLHMLQQLANDQYVPPYAVALIHAGLGDHEAALDWLERAHEAHDVHLVALPTDAKWDPLRGHPRFVALLRRCGFPIAQS